MDLQALREKLSNYSPAAPPNAAQEVPVDWPSTPIPRTHQHGSSPSSSRLAELAATVETLKRRSTQSFAEYSAAPGRSTTASATPNSVDLELHIRRLRAIADKINAFSAQQSQAMVEMHQIQQRLAASPEAGRLPLPRINFDEAMTASVEVDTDGNILLSYQTLNIDRQAQTAYVLADQLRQGTYTASGRVSSPPRQTRSPGIAADFSMLWREPISLGLQIWASLRRFLTHGSATSSMSQAVASSTPGATTGAKTTRSTGSPLSLLDAIIWLGGGVIGRVALNLLLAAVPALWSVAVAGITAMTAYALYRATLAPKLNFGLAYRVLLIVGGLIIGGHVGI